MLVELLPKPPGTVVEPVLPVEPVAPVDPVEPVDPVAPELALRVLSTLVNDALVSCALYVPLML